MLDFSSFTRRGLMVDRVWWTVDVDSTRSGGPCVPCRKWGRKQHARSRGCKTRKEVVEDRETTDLSAMAK